MKFIQDFDALKESFLDRFDRLTISLLCGTSVSRLSSAENPELIESVERLSHAAGFNPPKIYVIKTSERCIAGTSPQTGAIALSQKELDSPLDELEATIGHELGRRKQGKLHAGILASAAIKAGLAYFTTLAIMSTFSADSAEKEVRVSIALASVTGAAAAHLVQQSVQRIAEYDADAFSARITGNPDAMISSLQRADPGWDKNRTFKSLEALLSSHPATHDRITMLELLKTSANE